MSSYRKIQTRVKESSRLPIGRMAYRMFGGHIDRGLEQVGLPIQELKENLPSAPTILPTRATPPAEETKAINQLEDAAHTEQLVAEQVEKTLEDEVSKEVAKAKVAPIEEVEEEIIGEDEPAPLVIEKTSALAPSELFPIMSNPNDSRERIRRGALEGIHDFFPIIGSRHDIHVENLDVDRKIFSNHQHKKAIMEGRSLQEPVKGRLVIKDKQGKVVDRGRPSTLLNLPWHTPRDTFVLDGNEYNISNQIRLKPGAYTRKKGNEELEVQFNVQGIRNFKLSMRPETGILYMEAGTANLGLYPILINLDAHPNDIARAWGKELAEVNAKKFAGKEQSVLDQLYTRLVYKPDPSATPAQKKQAVDEYFARSHLDSNVTLKTLGRSYNRVDKDTILAASSKLIRVFRDDEEVDDRDNLEFKSFHQVDDLIKENLKVGGKTLRYKIQQKLDHSYEPTVRDVVPASLFTQTLKSFLTSTQLKDLPNQYNSIDLVDSSLKLTSMGEGGIGTDRAITLESRRVHPSQFGIIDPIVTPESGKIGIDLRMSSFAHKDKEGNLYAPFRNLKTNKMEYIGPRELNNSTILFPDQMDRYKKKRRVEALQRGKVTTVPASEADYAPYSMNTTLSPVTNLIPFIESIQGNRAIMVSKHITQALPLVDKEVPFVQVAATSKQSAEEAFGNQVILKSPVDGVIEKIDPDYIYIRPSKSGVKKASADAGLVRVPYHNYLPSGSKSGKTYTHHLPLIRGGDRVKQGQVLADSAETVNGTLALGRNLRVAYMPYKGYNSNDAVVISQSASQKLASKHMHKKILELDIDLKTGRESHRAQFGSNYRADQYNKLETNGVIKQGEKVEYGDIVIAAVRKTAPSPQAAILGKLHRSLMRPYIDEAITWDKDFTGTVRDVFVTPKRIAITILTEEPIKEGDKVTNRYGGKGVVSKIIPDEQMIKNEAGHTLDLLYPPLGIISRVNPGQVLETAIGKVAEKTGEPVKVPYFAGRNNVEWVAGELKKHNIKDKETLFDPTSNKKIPGVFTGPQYIFKLAKTTDTNFSARGLEGYDINEQPTSGGTSGSKALGRMEMSGLLAHNARNIIRDAASVKSQRNDEYWQRTRLGLPTIPPKDNFAYDKFTMMLQGAGIKVSKEENQIGLAPLTDNDIKKLSSGEIKEAKFVRTKDLRPEPGGFFDEAVTGGASGTRWGHIKLEEPVVNPVFIDPARRLMGQTGTAFKQKLKEEGAVNIKKELNAIDLKKKKRQLRQSLDNLSGAALQDAVKQLKAIDALEKYKLKAGDAYVLSTVPVTPPVTRPIIPNKKGELLMGDANYLLRDVLLANDALKTSKSLPKSAVAPMREHLQDSVGALFGTNEPASPQSQQRGVKGYLSAIAGSNPKHGHFQNKLIRRQQDLTGRSTAAPDLTLDMDELGLPEDMMWNIYEPFVMQRLVKKGRGALEAKKLIEDHHPAAREELLRESKDRPVFWNRAPSLHRFSIAAAYPKPVPGKTVRVPAPWPEIGMNLDYDGDAVQIHAPVSPGAVEEAKNMTLSKMIFSDKKPNDLLVKPQFDAAVGLWEATSKAPSRKAPTAFSNWDDAWKAYESGKLKINDPVTIR